MCTLLYKLHTFYKRLYTEVDQIWSISVQVDFRSISVGQIKKNDFREPWTSKAVHAMSVYLLWDSGDRVKGDHDTVTRIVCIPTTFVHRERHQLDLEGSWGISPNKEKIGTQRMITYGRQK